METRVFSFLSSQVPLALRSGLVQHLLLLSSCLFLMERALPELHELKKNSSASQLSLHCSRAHFRLHTPAEADVLSVLSCEPSLCPAASPDPPGPAHSRRHTGPHSTTDLSPGIEQDQDRAPGLRTRRLWGTSVDVRTEWVLGAAPSPRSSRTLGSHWDSNSPLSFPMATSTWLPPLSQQRPLSG